MDCDGIRCFMKYPEYIGDGVYVHLSEQHDVVLTTGHHDPNEAKNVIVLEGEVVSKLQRWLETTERANPASQRDQSEESTGSVEAVHPDKSAAS